MSIGIFYGSNGGATESVAEMILNALGLKAEVFDIADIDIDKLGEYSHLIIGTSTWGEGELQDDWDDKFLDYEQLDFTGKTVAFYGLGDQEGYGENFVDGMGILHDTAVKNGATVVGDNWPVDGYDFEDSIAVKDGAFIGLAIDEDNQDDLTEERIGKWADLIRPSFQ
ncbi:flavodoxin [Sulfurovum sp.]|uniref:flavodoxin n=1 Tax=Sulfurovum sp. TaxID=1969726 RepID=UPI002600C591|nr:flavodoxin [Sulfurovum sp.]